MCLDDTTVKFEIWDTAGQERLVKVNLAYSVNDDLPGIIASHLCIIEEPRLP